MEETVKEKKTILVVDDEKPIVDILLYNLEKEGYETLEANDGVTAVEIALEKEPDLILLDIMLPGEDGISILGKLRKKSATRDLPIIMMTAKGTEYDKVLGLDSGADDYITKPFGMMELVSRVKAVLRRSRRDDKKDEIIVGDQLLTNIWGYDFDGETRTVDVHIRSLRQKLGECGKLIETVRGIGYRIGGNE